MGIVTPLEKDSLETFLEIREHFAAGRHLPRWTYMEVMGHIRDMIYKLERYKAGCPTGSHMSECDCKPAVKGKCRWH